MPPLEDATANENYSAEALPPVEIRTNISRNSPQVEESTVAPPPVIELSTKILSQQQTTSMVSHSTTSKPDTKISDAMSRLRQRDRLRELARRRQQTSNNNNGEHVLLDRNIVTPVNIITEPVPGVDPTPSTSDRNTPDGADT